MRSGIIIVHQKKSYYVDQSTHAFVSILDFQIQNHRNTMRATDGCCSRPWLAGSVKNRKMNRRPHVLTEETLDEIGERLENTPQKFLKRLSQKTDVCTKSN